MSQASRKRRYRARRGFRKEIERMRLSAIAQVRARYPGHKVRVTMRRHGSVLVISAYAYQTYVPGDLEIEVRL